MTSDTVGHLLVAAALAWIAATEVLRFLHRRDRRRQAAARRAAAKAADAEWARVDAWSDDVVFVMCQSFERDFQVQP